MDFVALNALEMLSLRAIAWEYYVESYKKFLLRGDWFSYHLSIDCLFLLCGVSQDWHEPPVHFPRKKQVLKKVRLDVRPMLVARLEDST
jgi:hypothetical protein